MTIKDSKEVMKRLEQIEAHAKCLIGECQKLREIIDTAENKPKRKVNTSAKERQAAMVAAMMHQRNKRLERIQKNQAKKQ